MTRRPRVADLFSVAGDAGFIGCKVVARCAHSLIASDREP